MENDDLLALVDLIADKARGYTDRKVAGAIAELAQSLREQIATIPAGAKGEDGKSAEPIDYERITTDVLSRIPKPLDGKDAPPVDTERLAQDILARIPTPKDGKDGKDAEPVDMGALRYAIIQEIDGKFESLPTPKDGKDGKDAEPVNTERIIEEVLARIPQPRDGRDGNDGKDGASIHPDSIRVMVSDEVNRAVLNISEERIRGVMESIFNRWILDLDRQAREHIANMPKPRDAFEVKDFVLDFDGDSRFSVGFKTEADSQIREVRLPIPRDAGVFKRGVEYLRGHCVTHDSSYWIALMDNPQSVPGINSEGEWRLHVKRGQNGKDLRPTEPDPKPPVVRLK
jgi:hypothetical protein